MLIFNKKYFVLTIFLFVIEVLIALYLHDEIIRPYIGDVLVVILLYCMIKSFFKLPVFTVAISVLIFSFCVEFLQYLNIVEILGLQNSRTARIIIGTSFSWIDILTYIVGICIVLIVEKVFVPKKLN